MKKMIFKTPEGKTQRNPKVNPPNEDSLVLIYKHDNDDGYWNIKGFECSNLGELQEFPDECFIEPKTNALSKELAAKVIWEETIKNPAIQEKELNPKVFKTNQKF